MSPVWAGKRRIYEKLTGKIKTAALGRMAERRRFGEKWEAFLEKIQDARWEPCRSGARRTERLDKTRFCNYNLRYITQIIIERSVNACRQA